MERLMSSFLLFHSVPTRSDAHITSHTFGDLQGASSNPFPLQFIHLSGDSLAAEGGHQCFDNTRIELSQKSGRWKVTSGGRKRRKVTSTRELGWGCRTGGK